MTDLVDDRSTKCLIERVEERGSSLYDLEAALRDRIRKPGVKEKMAVMPISA